MRTSLKLSTSTLALLLGASVALAQGKGNDNDISPGAGSPGMSRSAEPGSGATGNESGGAAEHSKSSKGADKSAAGSNGNAAKAAESGNGAKGKSDGKAAKAESKAGAKQAADTPAPSKDKGGSKASDTNKGNTSSPAADAGSKDKEGKSSADAAKPDQSKSSTGTSTGETGKAGANAVTNEKSGSSSAKRVDLSGDKRDRAQASLRDLRDKGSLKHRADVHVSIAIGSRAPRDWESVPVPSTLVEVVPEYRGYLVAYVGDEYVISDPATYEVVEILPATGGTSASAGGSDRSASADQCSSSITLSSAERQDIIRSIELRNDASVSDVAVGTKVPDDVQLQTFPQSVIDHRSELRACRYFVANDNLVVVNPEDHTIVMLIEATNVQ